MGHYHPTRLVFVVVAVITADWSQTCYVAPGDLAFLIFLPHLQSVGVIGVCHVGLCSDRNRTQCLASTQAAEPHPQSSAQALIVGV